MKKFILTILLVLLCAGMSHSAELKQGLNIQDFSLSTNVEGAYYSNDAQSAYAIYTVNTKGDTGYGSGSFVTAIYALNDIVGATYASDGLTSEPTNYDSSDFDLSTWDIK